MEDAYEISHEFVNLLRACYEITLLLSHAKTRRVICWSICKGYFLISHKQLFLGGPRDRFPEKSEAEIKQLYLGRLEKCHNRNY